METRTLNRAERRRAKGYLEKQNKTYATEMAKIAIDDWPPSVKINPRRPQMIFRSKDFLAQFHEDPNGYLRMSVQRTTQYTDGNWKDGITFDELQRVKRECGFADHWFVECYPPDDELVNIANIRHLFLMPEAPPFAWVRKNG
jgi:hypothetical protein